MKEEFILDKEQVLLQEIARGERAKAIRHSAAWCTDIVPYLEKRKGDLSHGSSWKPASGIFNVDAVALGSAYNGGREEECGQLSAQLEIWIEQGRIAAENLAKEQAKAGKEKK